MRERLCFKKKLGEISRKIEAEGRSSENDEEEKTILSELYNTMAQEEIHWKQKSRVAWLKEGDKNTNFFKLTIISRRSYNRISKIKKSDQTVLQYMDDIKKEAITFYENLLALDQMEDEQAMDELLEEKTTILDQ